MTMRGRKPKPTSVKILTGNPGNLRLNHDEPKPPVAVPECPVELSPAAKAEWDRLGRELAGLRILTALDRAALAAYCEAYALWIEAITAVRKHGTMVKSPSGYPMQSPYVAIANKQAEIMMRIASEFGFTPASRSRISVPIEREPTLFDFADGDDRGQTRN
jgi:P27 family predicted phage terminase small subunit